jgi:hypothetical protein
LGSRDLSKCSQSWWIGDTEGRRGILGEKQHKQRRKAMKIESLLGENGGDPGVIGKEGV